MAFPTCSKPPAASADQRGVALVLTLIFAILLYILVAELVVTGRMVRATGENDALLARMQTQMAYVLGETLDELQQDLASAAAGGEGGSGGNPLGGALPGAASGPAGAGGEGSGEGESDPAATCDSSRDGWFHPSGKADNDITVYVMVEDENRKLNLLALWSPDEKFAEFTRDRLVRLIDNLRDDSDLDISASDAERIVRDIKDWGIRPDTETLPRAPQKSDDPKRSEITLPLHLDELLLLPSVTEDLFYDKVLDGKVHLGLESVLTIWTSLVTDPGNPQKVARQQAQAQSQGAGGANPGQAGSGQSGSGQAGSGESGAGSGSGAAGAGTPQQPLGEGIRINVNTASRPVLRALFPTDRIPDRVIDAIIKYRNEEDEEAQKQQDGQAPKTDLADFGSLRLGADRKNKVFTTVADLEKVPEFANLADAQIKADFQKALTTKSDVFTVHLAALHKRSDENRVYVLRRARAIVQRVDDGGTGKIRKLVGWEDRTGLRLQPVDLQENRPDLNGVYANLDQFAAEDRAWNPFLIDFYLPRHLRDEFYKPR